MLHRPYCIKRKVEEKFVVKRKCELEDE